MDRKQNQFKERNKLNMTSNFNELKRENESIGRRLEKK